MGRWAVLENAAAGDATAVVANTDPLEARRWVVANEFACAAATTPADGTIGDKTANDDILCWMCVNMQGLGFCGCAHGVHEVHNGAVAQTHLAPILFGGIY